MGGGRGPLSPILLLHPRSLPPHSVRAPRLLERLPLAEGPLQPPPVGSELSLWGGGGRSETLGPPPASPPSRCQSAPSPAPPSPTPFTAEPGASLGSRRNRLQNARARGPLPPRAARSRRPACARGPDPRPPGSAQPAIEMQLTGRREAGSEPPRPPGPPAVHFPSRGPPQEARLRAARPRTGLRTRGGGDPVPADPNRPGSRRLRGWEWERAARARSSRSLGSPIDFRGRTRPQTLGFGPFLLTREGLEYPPLPSLFRVRARSPGRGSQPPLPPEDWGCWR